MFKPQRAIDVTEQEVIELLQKYGRLYVMTKYDGVRCIVEDGIVKGKSLLKIPNKNVQAMYGKEEFEGKEFEIIVTDANGNYDPINSCRHTTAFINMHNKKEHHKCILIDNYHLGEFPFEDRLANLEMFAASNPQFQLPDYIIATTIEEVLHYEEGLLKNDQEGIVIRNPALTYKEGKSSPEGEFLRIKRFISEEAIIMDVAPAWGPNPLPPPTELYDLDGDEVNYYHKVPKAEIGKFFCKLVKNIRDPWSKRLIAKKGSSCVIATGNMPRAEKIRLWEERETIKGKMIKFRTFPKGSKDKPRFATYQCFVAPCDAPDQGD